MYTRSCFLINDYFGCIHVWETKNHGHCRTRSVSNSMLKKLIFSKGYFTFTHTERRTLNGKRVEQIMQLSDREYRALLNQRDPTHHPIHKKRKCFLWEGHYFQLDVFLEPCSQRWSIEYLIVVAYCLAIQNVRSISADIYMVCTFFVL